MLFTTAIFVAGCMLKLRLQFAGVHCQLVLCSADDEDEQLKYCHTCSATSSTVDSSEDFEDDVAAAGTVSEFDANVEA